MTEKNANQQKENEVQFQIQKIYLKEASFEIPEGAQIFNQQWQPELNIALNTTVNKLPEDNIYEVILSVEASVKCKDKEAFKAEVKQAGIFAIANMDEKQSHHAQYAFCPNVLYPYAREAVSDIVSKGGFPQLCLAPVNFDLLYQQKQSESATV